MPLPLQLVTLCLSEVRDAIALMPNNKAADCYGLRSEHFKIAGDFITVFYR